jgi:hypothetical protein
LNDLIGKIFPTAAAPKNVAVQLVERGIVPSLPGEFIAAEDRTAQHFFVPYAILGFHAVPLKSVQ